MKRIFLKITSRTSVLTLLFLILSLAYGQYSKSQTQTPPAPQGSVPPPPGSSVPTSIKKKVKDPISVYKPIKLRKVRQDESLYRGFLRFFKRDWKTTSISKKGGSYKRPIPLYDTGVLCGQRKIVVLNYHELLIAHPKYQKKGKPLKFTKGQGIRGAKGDTSLYSVYLYQRRKSRFTPVYLGKMKRLIGAKKMMGTSFAQCPDIYFEDVGIGENESQINYYWLVYEDGIYQLK